MMKKTAVWFHHIYIPVPINGNSEIFWKVIFVYDFIHLFIPQWHGDMAYAETVPNRRLR